MTSVPPSVRVERASRRTGAGARAVLLYCTRMKVWRMLATVGALAGVMAFPAHSMAAAKALTISVVSGRADLVSGGDALVRIGGIRSTRALRVTVAGKNRSKVFAV